MFESAHPLANLPTTDRFEQIAYWLGKEWKGPLADSAKRPMPKL